MPDPPRRTLAICGPGRTAITWILLALAGEFGVTEVTESRHLPDPSSIYLIDPRAATIPDPPFEGLAGA